VELVRTAGRRLRDIDLPPLQALEDYAVRNGSKTQSDRISLPLLAIVGPPRVGSTLLYQLLVARYELFYLDNFQHALLRYPYLAFTLSNRWFGRAPRTTLSDHGFVKGFAGVSEGNFFWDYWFDMAMAQKEPSPSPERFAHIATVLNRIHARVNRPMVSAFNAHAFYMEELARRFQRVVFIHLYRDPLANALSLLRARQIIRGDRQQWWSIRPKTCYSTGNPFAEIVCQILGTYAQIRESRQAHPTLNVVDVSYKELCCEPHATLERIARACEGAEIMLRQRTPSMSLPKLQPSLVPSADSTDAQKFIELFRTMEGERWQHPVQERN
jgi:hypothetical protein